MKNSSEGGDRLTDVQIERIAYDIAAARSAVVSENTLDTFLWVFVQRMTNEDPAFDVTGFLQIAGRVGRVEA